METIFFIALACASITFTITTTSIFKGFREWVSQFHPKLDELIHCPWCLSHYIAVLIILVLDRTINTQTNYVVDLLFTIFTTVGLVGLMHFVLLRAYEPVAKATARRHLEKLNNEKDQSTED